MTSKPSNILFTSFNLGYSDPTDKTTRNSQINFVNDFERFKKTLLTDIQLAPTMPKIDPADYIGFSYISDGTEINVTTPEEYKIYKESFVDNKKTSRTDIGGYLKVCLPLS